MKSETLSALDRIVLVRLLGLPNSFSVSKLAGDVGPLVGLDELQAQNAAEVVLLRLKERGFIKQRAKYRLNDAGESAAFAELGYSSRPKLQTINWDWTKKVLIGRRLRMLPTAALAIADDSNQVALWAITQKYGIKLPGDQLETAEAMLQALAWHALGLPDSGPFNENLGLGVLLGHPEIAPEDLEIQPPASQKPARKKAARKRSKNSEKKAIRASAPPRIAIPAASQKAARKKATRKPRKTPAKKTIRASAPPATGIVAFAEKVNEIALTTKEGRWLGHKVFIAQVWKDLARQPGNEMSLEHFKKRLVQAARGSHLTLSRADLIGVLPQEEVRLSETEYGDETFHFVETEHLG